MKLQVALVACLLSPWARAANPVTYALTGTITNVNGAGVKIGQKIPIVLVVDRAYPGQILRRGEALYAAGSFGQAPGPIMSATVNGVAVAGVDDGVFIQKNVDHQSELALFVQNPPPGGGISIGLHSGLSGAVQNLKIPSAIFPNHFQSTSFTYFSGPPYYYGFSGTIDGSPYTRPPTER